MAHRPSIPSWSALLRCAGRSTRSSGLLFLRVILASFTRATLRAIFGPLRIALGSLVGSHLRRARAGRSSPPAAQRQQRGLPMVWVLPTAGLSRWHRDHGPPPPER